MDLPPPEPEYLNTELLPVAPVQSRTSRWAGFPAGLVVGFVMASLLGIGIWLGSGLHANGGTAGNPTEEGRDAEISRKVAEARKQWDEKDRPLAVEQGRKEGTEAMKKDLQVARNIREAFTDCKLPLPALEDPTALKATLSNRLEASRTAEEDRKIAANCREILPEVFSGVNKAVLADRPKFKDELLRIRKDWKEKADKEALFEKEASLTKALSLVQFFFGFDAQAVRDMDADQLRDNVQTRYQDLLKDEHKADTELTNGNKARDDYKRFLNARLDSWRDNVKGGVRSESELRSEAREMRTRIGMEPRPDKGDPLLQRSDRFPYVTTWVLDYFEALDHYDFILKKSRRAELRDRVKKTRADLVKLRGGVLEELDRYLKTAPR